MTTDTQWTEDGPMSEQPTEAQRALLAAIAIDQPAEAELLTMTGCLASGWIRVVGDAQVEITPAGRAALEQGEREEQ